MYCPKGSHNPLTVDIGYYSKGGEQYGQMAHLYRTGQEVCPRGSYCDRGRKIACPPGTYGNKTMLFLSLCSGFCPAGYFCIEGSAEPRKCESNTYSTEGNRHCVTCNNPLPLGIERCRTIRLCCNQ